MAPESFAGDLALGPPSAFGNPGEGFLQLAAKDNIQICQPSNAAQYFHLLRRQALRHWRKPLIVFTPKSMLRHPDASSPIEDFTHANFLNVLPDTEVGAAERYRPDYSKFPASTLGQSTAVTRPASPFGGTGPLTLTSHAFIPALL